MPMSQKKIIIGTRGSDLALWQANYIKDELHRLGITAGLHIIKTKGDVIQNLSFDKMEGKGFFTKELEEALLNKTIDLAVHSHKDLETSMPEGLCIASVTNREDPGDMLLINKKAVDIKERFSLKKNASIGSSSLRRKALVDLFRPDCVVNDLRGNVPTRVQKLREEKYDAIILAAAGLRRLKIDLSEFHAEYLLPEFFIPAAAQGVLALQCRTEDEDLRQVLSKLNDEEVLRTIHIERETLRLLEGGCRLPVGVHAQKENNHYSVWTCYASQAGKIPRRVFMRGTDHLTLPSQIVKKVKTESSKLVFISRKEKEAEYFTRVLKANGCTIHAESLTSFKKIIFNGIPDCEWIFFSSRNCVKYFFDQQPEIPSHVKIGSIGGSTAEALQNRGVRADFTGTGPDTVEIGKQFVKIAGNKKVLFPQSTASYRTVQKQFSSQSQVIDMVVYDTIENDHANIPDADVVVLTSPSNAILYFRKKKILPDQAFIPIGNATAEILKKNGITSMVMPWNTNEIALADAVMSL